MTVQTIRADAPLAHVRDLLNAGRADEALAAIRAHATPDAAMRNALGVCQLRLGRHETAMWTFRDLVFPDGASVMPRQTPAVYVANYALAHLLMQNPVVGIAVLHQSPDRDHPAIASVRAMVRAWKQTFPWWRRLLTPMGVYPPGAPDAGAQPGWLAD